VGRVRWSKEEAQFGSVPAPVAARSPVVRSNASRERPVRSQETSCQWSLVFKEWASLSAAVRVLRRPGYLRGSPSLFVVAVLLPFPFDVSCFISCCCLKFLFPVPGFPVPVPLLIFPDPIQLLLVSILVEGP